MTTSYSTSTVEVIHAIPGNERDKLRAKYQTQDERPSEANDTIHRLSTLSQGPGLGMPPPIANTGRERERERDRSRRYHKSAPSTGINTSSGSGSSRHMSKSKSKSKNTGAKRSSVLPSRDRDHASDGSHFRHRRSHSSRSQTVSSSASSSEEEGEPVQDHRTVFTNTRARLTSPSTISTLTSATSTTNKSSSSSGSNSTVTQASIANRSSLTKNPDISQIPMSPAVPDAPDVFKFLDPEGSVIASGEPEEEPGVGATAHWNRGQLEGVATKSALPPPTLPEYSSPSSSPPSSFHGDDNSSEAAHDVETDRSTSPERSVAGQEEPGQGHDHDLINAGPPIDETSAKIASQIAAAQQRQNFHGSMHPFGTPTMQRGPAILPHIPSTALSSRYTQSIKQHPLPRAEKLPVTGYELLASQLSSRRYPCEADTGERIKPIYRKFEALNHRLLLHLQDELSELEEQLHRLDHTDTQSRRTANDIAPASRRAAAAAGGELQWHKTDVLGRIGYKLAQYNQALSSFNSTRSLAAPDPEDISNYRTYLRTVNPIAEAETHFLDPEGDLVSIYSGHTLTSSSFTPSDQSSYSSYAPSTIPSENKPEGPIPAGTQSQDVLPAVAISLAVAILVPILTFSVIPGFVGRLTATSLVVGGVLTASIQGGVVEQRMLFQAEGLICSGIYCGAMLVIAGILPG
ncbi:uncharacterized protein BP5553_09135 [Venustampulla echinocandica]|uniref:DUF6594 domain-containing protein n=1 Tax=Venustampulla echinocandica TaxID=2656787 RepID=A0A370TDZ3_9HELO|nr:uncharacterized protein BP5553_09135 [Venustampulla echinocandica]RDL32679.1 hypothetical protein BP5553_09135 [Venustampulla echinocandica]